MNTTKFKPIVAALGVTTALATAGMPANAAPATAVDPVVAASMKAGSDTAALTQISQEGHDAMREIQGARIAIFNGDPRMARELLDKAKLSLEMASKNAPTLVVDTKVGVAGKIVRENVDVTKMNWIPVDGRLSLADSYVATPERVAHVRRANDHFRAGRSKEAIDELRLGEIDVNYSRVLMPLQSTEKRVADAITLLANNKFYEADLALKSAEDGVAVDTVSLVDSPTKAVAREQGQPSGKPKG
jgi:D-alanyl-D-alanine carboxypeptidase